MEPKHVMIDLETMSTRSAATIISIGAVKFDPRFGILTKDTFYTELDWESQGRHICSDTMAWWDNQSPQARGALNGLEDLVDQLKQLASWLPKDAKVWGNGSTFDISILEDAFLSVLVDIPWKFWNVRDMRTIKDLYESSRGGLNISTKGVKHNALDDAISQAKQVNFMWKAILGGK